MQNRSALLLVVVFLAGTLAAPVLAAAAAAPSQPATGQTPQQIVQSIADQLAKALKGRRAELRKHPAQMVKLVNNVLLPHFDRDYAALLVLGQHARSATPAQRVAFTHAFYNALTDRYAEGLLAYTRGAVTVLPSRGPLDQRRTLVRTRVHLPNDKSLSVDFAFHKTSSGQWKAYDVIVEGISFITNYRHQVDAEIRKVGIAGLIKRLQTQGAGEINQMQKQKQTGGH